MKTQDIIKSEFEAAFRQEFPNHSFHTKDGRYLDHEVHAAYWTWKHQESRVNKVTHDFQDARLREETAKRHAFNYNFGEGVFFEAWGEWDTSDKNDITVIAYLRFEDSGDMGSDSIKSSVHVKFDEDGNVTDVYALEHRHGNEIGFPGNEIPGRQPKL